MTSQVLTQNLPYRKAALWGPARGTLSILRGRGQHSGGAGSNEHILLPVRRQTDTQTPRGLSREQTSTETPSGGRLGWGLWRGRGRGQERGFTAAIICASTSRKTAAGGGEQHGVKPGPGKVLGALGSGERRMRLEGTGPGG